MKSIIAAGLLLGMAHGTAAVAGPYANIENNASFLGDEFGGSVTEVHAGVELGDFYVQGGPAFVAVEGEEGSTEISGKVGVSVDLTEELEVYGEVAFITEEQSFEYEDTNFATKVGVTYRF